MAKKNIERFYTHVKQEGDAGATRGKVSVAMCEALGAGHDDVIEYEVQNGVIVGGHVLSKSEKKEWTREHGGGSRRPAAKESGKKVKKSKPVVKSSVDEERPRKGQKKGKKVKKTVKSSKRATKVSYESQPKAKSGKKTKLKLKLKKPRR